MNWRPALLLCLLVCVGVGAAAPARDLSSLMPPAAGDFTPYGEAGRFTADDLFDLLNGGAAAYVEYGVVSALTQEYTRGEASIVCTIFEMKDPEAAFGLFSFGRGAGRTPIPVGDGGLAADVLLSFWQDRYFVTVEASAPDAALIDSARAMATTVSQRIGAHAVAPPIVERLRPFGVTPGTERLVAGRVAADNLLFIGKGDVLRLTAGDRLLYGERPAGASVEKILLAIYRDATKAAGTADEARTAFQQAGYQPAGADLFVKNGKYVGLASRADSLLIVADAPSPEEATAVLAAGLE